MGHYNPARHPATFPFTIANLKKNYAAINFELNLNYWYDIGDVDRN
jgi:hypothetical protein